MTDKIIITTEEVRVNELEGRERTIYDYAYNKGHEDALDKNKNGIADAIVRGAVIIAGASAFAIVMFGLH